MTTSFAWKVISSDLVGPSRCSLREREVLQLKGIFLSLDEDKDGQLTTLQLVEALKLLGFSTREKFVLKFYFYNNGNGRNPNPNVPSAGSSVGMGIQALTFKTDFSTFCSVIGKELKVMKEIEIDLDYLFNFIADESNTGYLSKKELKHMLVDISSPTAMTEVEFTRFTKSIVFPSDSQTISISDFKVQLIFGLLYSQ